MFWISLLLAIVQGLHLAHGSILCPSSSFDLFLEPNLPVAGIPNETHPFDAFRIIARALDGGFASVGGERVLFNYLLAPETDVRYVLAVDLDPGINLFHELNSILVRMVGDGDTDGYRKTRFRAKAENWEKLGIQAIQLNRITTSELNFALKHIEWWKRLMAIQDWSYFQKRPSGPRSRFFAVNYLHTRSLLLRIQKLALSGGYRTLRVNLAKASDVIKLRETIRDLGGHLSLMDLSNVWSYVSSGTIANLMRELKPVFSSSVVVMSTSFTHNSNSRMQWHYESARFQSFEPNHMDDDRFYLDFEERLIGPGRITFGD